MLFSVTIFWYCIVPQFQQCIVRRWSLSLEPGPHSPCYIIINLKYLYSATAKHRACEYANPLIFQCSFFFGGGMIGNSERWLDVRWVLMTNRIAFRSGVSLSVAIDVSCEGEKGFSGHVLLMLIPVNSFYYCSGKWRQ